MVGGVGETVVRVQTSDGRWVPLSGQDLNLGFRGPDHFSREQPTRAYTIHIDNGSVRVNHLFLTKADIALLDHQLVINDDFWSQAGMVAGQMWNDMNMMRRDNPYLFYPVATLMVGVFLVIVFEPFSKPVIIGTKLALLGLGVFATGSMIAQSIDLNNRSSTTSLGKFWLTREKMITNGTAVVTGAGLAFQGIEILWMLHGPRLVSAGHALAGTSLGTGTVSVARFTTTTARRLSGIRGIGPVIDGVGQVTVTAVLCAAVYCHLDEVALILGNAETAAHRFVQQRGYFCQLDQGLNQLVCVDEGDIDLGNLADKVVHSQSIPLDHNP